MSLLGNFGRRIGRDNHVLKNSLTLAITSLLANLFNYLFYFYTARYLGPTDYGIFGTLLSIYFGFFFLTNIMNYLVINYISYFKAKTQYDKIRRLFDVLVRSMALIGGVIFLAMWMLSSRINAFIHAPTTVPIIFLGLFLWAYIILASFFGMLNGMQKFSSLGSSRVLDGFFTLIFGVIFLSLDMGISGGMLALFFAALLTIPFAIVPLKYILAIHPARIGDIGIWEYVVKAIVPSIFIAIMLNADVILVKLVFDDVQAGYFAAASLMGKVIFFICSGMMAVIFPKAAELSSNGHDATPLLKDGLTYTAIVGFAISLLYIIFPNFFAHILFSQEYQISDLIGPYALSVTFLSMANVFVMYNMAIKKFGASYILIPFTAIQLTAMAVFHSSLRQVLVVNAFVMFLMCMAIIYFNKEDFIKMFKKTTGYHKYPISAYLRVKTSAGDESTSSSRKIKVKELNEFLPYDDVEMVDIDENGNKRQQ